MCSWYRWHRTGDTHFRASAGSRHRTFRAGDTHFREEEGGVREEFEEDWGGALETRRVEPAQVEPDCYWDPVVGC